MTQPVFLTGASGFIARHVLLALLRQGHTVRASVRTAQKADHVRASMVRHLGAAYDPDKLAFVHLDLTRDAGWTEAMQGCGALIHTASPVPMTQPDDPEELIRPAVDGTLRALNAARDAGIPRVVLTSSVAAISGEMPQGQEVHLDESDWTNLDLPGLSPYSKSKTMAERAAWDFAAQHPDMTLTTVNPAFVFGPALDEDFGASLSVLKRVLKGRDPMLPKISFAIVDVRDVARMHVAALSAPEAAGQRVIACSGQMWMRDIAAELARAFPDRRIPRRVAPNWLIRLLALRDKPLRFIVPSLGRRTVYNGARGRALLGGAMIPPEQAVLEAGKFLVGEGHV